MKSWAHEIRHFEARFRFFFCLFSFMFVRYDNNFALKAHAVFGFLSLSESKEGFSFPSRQITKGNLSMLPTHLAPKRDCPVSLVRLG